MKLSSPPTPLGSGGTNSDPTVELNRLPLVLAWPGHPLEQGLSPLVAKGYGSHGGLV